MEQTRVGATCPPCQRFQSMIKRRVTETENEQPDMIDFANRRTTMVDTQVRPSDVTKFPIIDAMLSVPREAFVPTRLKEAAYAGETLDIGDGREMLEPRTFAKMLDALNIESSDVVLDIACGFGYSTAVIAHMAEFVAAVEDNAARATEAQENLSTQGIDNAAVIEGPLVAGAAKSGPYDIIILQGGVDDIPAALLDQLRDGGRIAAIFKEGSSGAVKIGHKIDGRMSWRFAFNASAPVLSGFQKEASFTF